MVTLPATADRERPFITAVMPVRTPEEAVMKETVWSPSPT